MGDDGGRDSRSRETGKRQMEQEVKMVEGIPEGG